MKSIDPLGATPWLLEVTVREERESLGRERDSDCRTPKGRRRIYAASFAAAPPRRIIKVRCPFLEVDQGN